MILAFFDFETTDKDPSTARITDAAVALVDSETQKIIQTFASNTWDESYEKIHPTAAAITGLSDEFIEKYGIPPRYALANFGTCMARAEYCVAHNGRAYDLPLLREELKRNSMELAIPANIDTRYDLDFPEHIDTRKLSYLAAEHGILASSAHSALGDVLTMKDLFFKYDINRTIELSKSPEIWVKAGVTFDTRELAKERKYSWFPNDKVWAKQIKELFIEKEALAPFSITLLAAPPK